jgi:hypothetical protein
MKLHLKYTEPQLDIFFPDKPERHTVIPKGRRFGATHGAANACIEWGIEGMPMLWGDTIFGNIKRYWDRYFKPSLHANGMEDNFNERTQVAKIGSGFIDFRSADRPENWEGFGYRKIILNEAGIILQDPYLYTNAVRPMMLDFPDSELFALGVPKGKKLKNGDNHPFYDMHLKVGTPGYRGKTYTSYDNPLIRREDVDNLIADMAGDPEQVKQEIFGEFIDRIAGTPFAYAFDPQRHVGRAQRRPGDVVYFSIDFNVEPFTATASHIWQDAQGHHFHTFAEAALKDASIRSMAEWMRAICPLSQNIKITGDRGGMSRGISTQGPMRLFDMLQKELRVSPNNFLVPPNPTHIQSREDCNFVLTAHPDCIIDTTCTRLISDMRTVEVEQTGTSVKIKKADRSKASQQADALDCWRYVIGTYLRNWIQQQRQQRR